MYLIKPSRVSRLKSSQKVLHTSASFLQFAHSRELLSFIFRTPRCFNFIRIAYKISATRAASPLDASKMLLTRLVFLLLETKTAL